MGYFARPRRTGAEAQPAFNGFDCVVAAAAVCAALDFAAAALDSALAASDD